MTPRDVVERFVRCFVLSDMDAALAMLAEDIVVRECESLPYPGDHRGKEAFIQLSDAIRDTWDFKGRPTLTLIGDEDRAVMLVSNHAIARATGRHIDLRLAEVYTVRNGLIAEIEMFYWDTAAIAAALSTD